MDNININIHINFDEYITSDYLINTVSSIERAIFKEETILLKKIRKEFTDLPTLIYDAMEFRLQKNKGKTLQIKNAENGSIIIFGAAVGISYWLLKLTLGETLKESWFESDSHKRLKKYLNNNLFEKSQNIKSNIVKELDKKGIESIAESIEENNDKKGIESITENIQTRLDEDKNKDKQSINNVTINVSVTIVNEEQR